MKLVVLLSGGIDSTVVLASRVAQGDEVVAVSFDYGQAHLRELEAARKIAAYYDVQHEIVVIPTNVLRGEAVTEGDTIVPARNLVMLSIAAAIGDREHASAVLYGANADDRAGFPDCRPDFVTAIDAAVRKGCTVCTHIGAPLIGMTKKQIVQQAREMDIPLNLTWSCYQGRETPCNECGACTYRNEAML